MVATGLIELFVNSAAADTMENIENLPDFRKQYLSHCDINDYLDSLQAKYPHLVQVKIIGYSFENRVLKSIHISKPIENNVIESGNNKAKSATINDKPVRRPSLFISKPKNETSAKQKKVILIDAGIHAREWCTISTALYCASQLTDNFDANKDLLNAFDFVIVPIVNPDGYEFSRTSVRLHRFREISC